MRVLQARAQRDLASGNLFPQLQQGFGAYNRVAESAQVANRSPTQQRFFNDWILGGQLAWEMDFWGQFRRNLAAADARLDAQIEDYDDVLVILVADVATAYIDYRTFEQRLVYARQNLTIQEESVRLAQIKVKAGTRESELDLPQAQADLANIQALIPDLELGRRQAMNRISVLLGLPPADLTSMLGTNPIPIPPPDLALGIPADLLRQRPDIRRAERELAAQCEEIGIAVADLYPHISIDGTIFVNSEKFSNLFTPKAWGGAVGPSFRWDILNYGRLRANIRLQAARFNELIYNYQHKVLLANEEVEDAVASYLFSHQKALAFQTGADVSTGAVDVGTRRYRDGVSDFNRLSNLQVELARQQDALAFSQGQIAKSWVDVYRSLGGGWQIRLANAQPYMPGISTVQPNRGDDLPSPARGATAPPIPDPAPTDSDQSSSASPAAAAEPALLKYERQKSSATVLSRLTAAKNYLFRRKSTSANVSAQQLAQVPAFDFPEFLTPDGYLPDADWSDLVDSSPRTPLDEPELVGTGSELSNHASSQVTTATPPLHVFSGFQAPESVIDIPSLNSPSLNRSRGQTIVDPLAVESPPAQTGGNRPKLQQAACSTPNAAATSSVPGRIVECPPQGSTDQPIHHASAIKFSSPVSSRRQYSPERTLRAIPQDAAVAAQPINSTELRSAATTPTISNTSTIVIKQEIRSSCRPAPQDPNFVR